jgi:hypothetical protein
MPPHFSPLDSSILAGVAATIMITVSLYLLKNRWPAGLTCWMYHVVLLAPVLGIVQTGPQLVADRYSYLSSLGWPVLAGGALFTPATPITIHRPVRLGAYGCGHDHLVYASLINMEAN